LAIVAGIGLTGLKVNEADAQERFAHMAVTGKTTQPIGHYEYCRRFPAECRVRSADTRPVKLTRQRLAEIVEVNDQVNRAVSPVTDLEYYRVEEYWTMPDRFGDCEDYVLAKRQKLLARGWPASSLLITVVRQANGDGHAVLTVRTDRADYVLDNLDEQVKPWSEAGYHFLKRQSAQNSGAWEGIDDLRPTLVGSN
jgi:predicted transglutaminase-like cysteine proteinase